MSEKVSEKGLVSFNIQQRLNDAATSFTVTIRPREKKEFKTGDKIQFLVRDNEVFTGRAETVTMTRSANGLQYTIGGYNDAFLLSRQPFAFGAVLRGGRVFPMREIIENILRNTKIIIGASESIPQVQFSNNALDPYFYGGEFRSKVEALNTLFTVANDQDANVGWYIDPYSIFRVFSKGDVTDLPVENMINIEIRESSEGVYNYYEGATGPNGEVTRSVSDAASIEKYGLRVGERITVTCNPPPTENDKEETPPSPSEVKRYVDMMNYMHGYMVYLDWLNHGHKGSPGDFIAWLYRWGGPRGGLYSDQPREEEWMKECINELMRKLEEALRKTKDPITTGSFEVPGLQTFHPGESIRFPYETGDKVFTVTNVSWEGDNGGRRTRVDFSDNPEVESNKNLAETVLNMIESQQKLSSIHTVSDVNERTSTVLVSVYSQLYGNYGKPVKGV